MRGGCIRSYSGGFRAHVGDSDAVLDILCSLSHGVGAANAAEKTVLQQEKEARAVREQNTKKNKRNKKKQIKRFGCQQGRICDKK